MGSHQIMHNCKYCKKQTIHLGVSTSHILHLLLSVISAGLWVPVWIVVAISNNREGQCTECGKKFGIFG